MVGRDQPRPSSVIERQDGDEALISEQTQLGWSVLLLLPISYSDTDREGEREGEREQERKRDREGERGRERERGKREREGGREGKESEGESEGKKEREKEIGKERERVRSCLFKLLSVNEMPKISANEPLRPPAKRASLLCKGGRASPKFCEHESHMALSTMCSIQNPQSMSPTSSLSSKCI